jgi:eukaryotic-like serine/threonine-protein kinase
VEKKGAPIVIGQRVGHYEVEAKLGEGGMGVVYRAVDTHLHRHVALKFIRTPVNADPERRQRFLQEAQATSALNHPNIVTVYGIETADSSGGVIDVIAMECVVGKTLDEILRAGRLPLDAALSYAGQIADGLAAAHAAGIIHRDLKPSNVMVTEGGRVKVLDFGVAKLMEGAGFDEASPTRTGHYAGPLTTGGRVVGTASYMSPEQAEGRSVDARSDVFAMGAVVYEMVTGRRAFPGDSRRSDVSPVAGEEPEPIHTTRGDAPAELQRIVAQCLRKDPARRFQHMGDVKVALDDVREEWNSRGARPTSAKGVRRSRARWAVVMLLIALIAAVGGALAWRKAGAPAVKHDRSLTQVTRDSGLTTDAAPSPAGNLLAYASDRSGDGNLDIWVQPFPRGAPLRLTRSEADDYQPSFSPDGSRIAFRSERDGGAIYVVSALGGQETRVAEKGRRPRFSPDGNWIAYFVGDTVLSSGTIHVIAAAGGTPRQLGPSRLRAREPIWSPDGRHLLCRAFPVEKVATMEWVLLPVDGGDPVETGAGEALARENLRDWGKPDAWAPDGETVFFSARSGDSTNVWKLRLSAKTGRVAAPPQQVTFGTGLLEKPAVLGEGRLLFTSANANVDLWGSRIDPATGTVTGAMEQVTREPGREDWPSISADGTRVAYLSERSGTPEVWVKDLEREREIAITVSRQHVAYPRIAADGTRVGYLVPAEGAESAASSSNDASDRPSAQRGSLFVASISPAGEVSVPVNVCEDCGRLWDWSRDGRYVLSRGAAALTLLDLQTGARTDLAQFTSTLFDARFAPDDKWIAFTVHTGALTRQNFVAPFRGPSPIETSAWVAITDGRALDRQVSWAPRGDMLYFQSERDGFRCIWAARLDPATKRPLGDPFPVQHFHRAQRSLVTAIRDPGSISISNGGSRMVFSLGEMTGNIWVTRY